MALKSPSVILNAGSVILNAGSVILNAVKDLCPNLLLIALPILLIPNKSLAEFAEHWVAYGDLRGYLEPCGCDPSTDLGGIMRIGNFLTKEKSIQKDLLVFNLGNNLPPPNKNENHKIPFLLEAVSGTKPTAALFNFTELNHSDEILRSIPKDSFWVLSNAVPTSNVSKKIPPVLIRRKVIVFGYVYDEGHKSNLKTFGPEFAHEWSKAISEQKTKQSVLLFSGSDDDLNKIIASKIFDLIISSNASAFDVLPGSSERERPGTLLRSGGVYQVPLGGTGILRGGTLKTKNAPKALDELLGKKSCSDDPNSTCKNTESNQPFNVVGTGPFSWLDQTYAHGEEFTRTMARYNAKTRQIFKDAISLRKEQLKHTSFAGSASCKGCHAEAYKIWTGSKHAHAFSALQNKQKDQDSECVNCHVLGFEDAGGFVSFKDSPNFANVNCENCHGPRLAHTRDAKQSNDKKGRAKEICMTCHLNPHSSHFVFEQYWEKIKHGF